MLARLALGLFLLFFGINRLIPKPILGIGLAILALVAGIAVLLGL